MSNAPPPMPRAADALAIADAITRAAPAPAPEPAPAPRPLVARDVLSAVLGIHALTMLMRVGSTLTAARQVLQADHRADSAVLVMCAAIMLGAQLIDMAAAYVGRPRPTVGEVIEALPDLRTTRKPEQRLSDQPYQAMRRG